MIRRSNGQRTLLEIVACSASALCFASNAIGAQTPSAANAPHPISLDEAVTLAQRNAPASVAARGTTRSTAYSVRSAKAAFLPSLNLNVNSTRQGGDRLGPQGNLVPFTGPPWSYSTGLQGNVDLYDGGRRLANLRSARANVDAAEAGETSALYRVALDVKQQYFVVLASREAMAAARTQLEQATQQLNASSARVKAGAATVSDSLRSVIQLGNAQLALSTAENSINVANATLTRLIGTGVPVTAADRDPRDAMALALDSAQLAALAAKGPAVEQAEANLSAAKAAARAAKAPYLPTLSSSFNYSGNGNDQHFRVLDDRYAYSNSVRVGLSYPIFNQLQREEGVVRASIATENAEATLRDAKLSADQQLAQYLGALRTAQQRASIQEATVAAAQEDLRVQQQRYTLGASTLLDLLTSQTTLTQAQSALIQARYDARVAKAQLEALVGRAL
jgi:outer membrane protein